MKEKAEKKIKNGKKIEREGGFFCFWLFWYQQVIFSLRALTDIYTFVIMTALRTSQRKGDISKGGRGDEVNLS